MRLNAKTFDNIFLNLFLIAFFKFSTKVTKAFANVQIFCFVKRIVQNQQKKAYE